MNSIVNLDKYRKLPITSLVAGILSFTFLYYSKIVEWVSSFLATYIFNIPLAVILGICLPITAIICGSIDLKMIKKGLHKNKVFRGMDITGIVLGSIILLIVAFLILWALQTKKFR